MKRLLAIALLIGSTGAISKAEVASQQFRMIVPQSVEVSMQAEKSEVVLSDGPLVPSDKAFDDRVVSWQWSVNSNVSASVQFSFTGHTTPQLAVDELRSGEAKDRPSLRIRLLETRTSGRDQGQRLVRSKVVTHSFSAGQTESPSIVTGASLARFQVSASEQELEVFGQQLGSHRIEIAATISAL